MADKDFEAPQDDQGINTQYALEVGEKLIQRCWKHLEENEEVSLEDLEKLANITDIAYELSIKALKVGEILTSDYFGEDGLDFDDSDEEDEDGFNL